jgi:hypothetical protein
MRKPRSALILFVLLIFTLAVPAEDVLETTYDESATQPYEAIPLFSIRSLPACTRTTQAVRSAVGLRSGAPFQSVVTCINGEGATGSPNVRGALGLRCILRC